MEIKTLKVGLLRTNCYIVISSDKALIIDPGGDPNRIIQAVDALDVVCIVATHGHFDHVLAVPVIKKELNTKFLMHRADVEIMGYFRNMLPFGVPSPDGHLDEGSVVLVGDIRLYVLHTPGHTPGSICLYSPEEKIVFTGDTLFRGAFGRTDLIGGDSDMMFRSLRKIFMLFTRDYTVYPGHGGITTIGDERASYEHLLRI